MNTQEFPIGSAHLASESGAEERWRARRVTAGVVRLLILLVPIAAGFAVGAAVSLSLPEPATVYEVTVWWIAVVAAATVTSTAVDRVARSFLPLTVLLRMTMLFPDAAPPRFRTARKAGNVTELRRRILAAGDGGAATDLAEMAELVLALSTALSNHDRKTRGHSERTRAYTDMLAEEMGIPEGDRDRLRWAALLHDVGKLEVPTEILNKDSSLDPEEWELIKQHPLNGMRLVAPLVPWLGEWAQTIEHHHERYDGSGYPHGLAGEQICLGARIVTVADAFDVMTSGRSYQASMSPAAARREIADLAGVQFDPDAARALMTVSLGRLRWSAGPLAALAQIPIFRGLPQVGRDLAMVLTTSAVLTTGFITGALPVPDPVSAAQIVEVVIAGGGVSNNSEVRGLGGLPLAAAESEPTRQQGDESLTDETLDATEDRAVTTSVPVVEPATTTTTAAPPPTATTTTTTTTSPPTTTTTTTTTTIAEQPAETGAVVANNDNASVGVNGSVNFSLLANDTGPIEASTLRIESMSSGSVSILGTSGRVLYTAEPDFSGNATFTYIICSATGSCDSASVFVQVG